MFTGSYSIIQADEDPAGVYPRIQTHIRYIYGGDLEKNGE